MTLNDIQDLLITVDPDIKHYFSMSEARSYSYWEETRRLSLTANGRHEEGWHFYVHLFSKIEGDPKAASFFDTLDEDVRTTVTWTVDPMRDEGYIHLIFECEGY